EAHRALLRFVQQAQRSGARVVLVVTGKGGGDDAIIATERERGVLRRLVPHWLAEPALRALVLGFEPAARGHGGAGALDVRIRRSRGASEGFPKRGNRFASFAPWLDRAGRRCQAQQARQPLEGPPMSNARYDVLGIGNAIVDVIATTDEA